MPRRSRGCQACRQRRIGCDGALPACRQCVLWNRQCSGPVTGPIIINQSAAVVKKHGGVKYSSPRTVQPSQGPIMSATFVSHFVAYLAPANESPRSRPWPYTLDGFSLADRGPALDLAMEAVGMAFFSMGSHNQSAVVESRRIYGQALRHHSAEISRRGAKERSIQIMARVYTTIMLSAFEAMWPTSSTAYAAHLSACWEILAVADQRGQQIFSVSQMCSYVWAQSLFSLVVAPDTTLSQTVIKNGELGALDSHLRNLPSSIFDKLILRLLCLQLARQSRKYSASKDDSTLHAQMGGSDISDISWLDSLWEEFKLQESQADPAQSTLSHLMTDHKGQSYRNAFTAHTIAYFAATRILCAVARRHDNNDLSGLQQDEEYEEKLEEHCNTIIQCSHALMGKPIGCLHLRMYLPLTLVALYSYTSEHHIMACTRLREWLGATSFGGLASLAFARVEGFRKSNTLGYQKRAKAKQLRMKPPTECYG